MRPCHGMDGLHGRHGVVIHNLILVRYNMAAPKQWLAGRAVNLDNSWLSGRERLYFDYCLPSLRRQVADGFKVLLFVDERTPTDLISRLRSDDFVYPIFTTEKIDSSEDMLKEIVDKTAEFLEKDRCFQSDNGTKILATTRLDSDDALSPDYINLANTAYIDQECGKEIYVYFPIGQQYIESSEEYLEFVYPGNAFGTLFEPITDRSIKTVMHVQHTKLIKNHKSVSVGSSDPHWSMIIHDGNVLNKRRGHASGANFFKM